MKRTSVWALIAAAVACGVPGGRPIADLRVEPVPPSVSAPQVLPKAPVRLPDGVVLQAEFARSPDEREIGMMFRTELPEDAAMMFVFPVEQGMMFWMKNTLVDLDIIFLKADKTVSVVHAEVPKSRTDTTDENIARRSGLARFVLELPAGAAKKHGIVAGSRLDFDGN